MTIQERKEEMIEEVDCIFNEPIFEWEGYLYPLESFIGGENVAFGNLLDILEEITKLIHPFDLSERTQLYLDLKYRYMEDIYKDIREQCTDDETIRYDMCQIYSEIVGNELIDLLATV